MSCAHFIKETQTCKTSLVAASKTKQFFNLAVSVRADPKKCGPAAMHYVLKVGHDYLGEEHTRNVME